VKYFVKYCFETNLYSTKYFISVQLYGTMRLAVKSSHFLQQHSIATKDIATEAIKTVLLCVKEEGMLQVEKFVSERLRKNKSVSYHAPVKLNKAPTFQDLLNFIRYSSPKL